MLLEKVAQLNKKDSSQVSEVRLMLQTCASSELPAPIFVASQDGSANDTCDTSLKFEEVDVDNVSLLTVSVQGKRYSITPHEVSTMSLQSFSALWTVSADHDRTGLVAPVMHHYCDHPAVQQKERDVLSICMRAQPTRDVAANQ